MADFRRPQASRLAGMLVTEFFGEVCGAVCSALLQRGQQRLPELEKSSGLPPNKVKTALLVLLQQGIVNAYRVTPEAGLRYVPLSYHVYRANVVSVLHLMRKPYALAFVEADYESEPDGRVYVDITQVLLEHGCLRWDQVLHIVAKQQQGKAGELVIGECFERMVRDQLVERAPSCNMPPPVEKVHRVFTKAKKPPQEGSLEEAQMLAEAAVQLVHSQYRSMRFDAPDLSEQPRHPAPGDKRKRGSDGSAPELWRLNFEEITRRSRCEQCVGVVRQMHGDEDARLIAAVLRAGNGRVHEAAEGELPGLSAADIAAATSGKWDFPTWEKHRVFKELRKLEAAEPALLRSESEPGRADVKFSVHMDTALNLVRNQVIEKVVLDRHGQIGLRIFRLLKEKRQLEQKQVADLAVLPPKDAREALYSLFQDGFVAFQDIPKLPDHAASRTFFTWSVNSADVVASLVSDWLKAAGNIRARIGHVFKQHAQVLNLLMGPGAEAASKQLTPAQRAAVAKYRHAKLVGERDFVALDPFFALFVT